MPSEVLEPITKPALSPFEMEPATESERQDLPSSMLSLAEAMITQAFQETGLYVFWSPSKSRYAQREHTVKAGDPSAPKSTDPLVRSEYLLVISHSKKQRTAKDGTTLRCEGVTMERAWAIADQQHCVGLIEIDDVDGRSVIRRNDV